MDNRILEIILRARDEASKTIEKASKGITGSLKDAENASKGFATGLLAVGAATAGVIGYGARIAADLETSRQGFVTLLGSARKADEIIAQIKKDAARTPFELPGLIAANQALTLVTKNGQQSEGILLNIGKALAAAGKGQPELDRMIANLQQIGLTGKITEMDIRQFGMNGVNVLEILADHYGVTTAEASDMVKNSSNAFADLEAALAKAGSAGGRFANAYRDQAGTFTQSLSNAKDTLGIFLADLAKGTGAFELMKNAMQGFVAFMNEHGDEIIAGVKVGLEWLANNGPIVAGIIIGGLTPAMYAFAASVVASVIALAPFLIAGAAVGLLAKVIIDNWTPISGFFVNTWATITSTIQAAVSFITGQVSWLKNNWVEAVFFIIGYMASLSVQLPFLMGQAVLAMINHVRSVDWFAVFSGILNAARSVLIATKDAVLGQMQEMFSGVAAWWNRIEGIFNSIRNAASSAIEAINNGLNAGHSVGMRFADGGWVPYTGNAIVHAGEFVLSRDMLTGREPIPSGVINNNQRNQTVQVGPVYVQGSSDVDSLAYRLGFHLQTAGNL
jgi:tape measure domain-containing protein